MTNFELVLLDDRVVAREHGSGCTLVLIRNLKELLMFGYIWHCPVSTRRRFGVVTTLKQRRVLAGWELKGLFSFFLGPIKPTRLYRCDDEILRTFVLFNESKGIYMIDATTLWLFISKNRHLRYNTWTRLKMCFYTLLPYSLYYYYCYGSKIATFWFHQISYKGIICCWMILWFSKKQFCSDNQLLYFLIGLHTNKQNIYSSYSFQRQMDAILILLSFGEFIKVMEMLFKLGQVDRAVLLLESCVEFGLMSLDDITNRIFSYIVRDWK